MDRIDIDTILVIGVVIILFVLTGLAGWFHYDNQSVMYDQVHCFNTQGKVLLSATNTKATLGDVSVVLYEGTEVTFAGQYSCIGVKG